MTITEPRRLDLTDLDDAIEFAKNYKVYLPHTSLPKFLVNEILDWENNYNLGIITSNELYNVILDLIVTFIDTLFD